VPVEIEIGEHLDLRERFLHAMSGLRRRAYVIRAECLGDGDELDVVA
jgi:hypothetical protein